jgi:hypothetical protein
MKGDRSWAVDETTRQHRKVLLLSFIFEYIYVYHSYDGHGERTATPAARGDRSRNRERIIGPEKLAFQSS